MKLQIQTNKKKKLKINTVKKHITIHLFNRGIPIIQDRIQEMAFLRILIEEQILRVDLIIRMVITEIVQDKRNVLLITGINKYRTTINYNEICVNKQI